MTFTINNPVPDWFDLAQQRHSRRPNLHAHCAGVEICFGLGGELERIGPHPTFVSKTKLTASIPAADIATAGTASVTVVNGPPGGGTSNAKTFTINP
jgi:hypothetical protein